MFSIRRLGFIGRTYRHFHRYNRILQVLFKYGFSDVLERLHIDQYLESGLQFFHRSPKEQLEPLSRPERLRMAFEELGPTFTKLGQVLSTRPDLLPLEYQVELAKLQDEVPPVSAEAIDLVFQREFGVPAESIFSFFDPNPIAAASIAQVHRARLDDGAEVAVKIRRPGIEQLIRVDLEILAHLAGLMEQYLEEVQGYSPSAVVEQFADSLSREVDFSIELTNIQRFSRQFAGNASLYVPKVYPERSTSRVLVMEYINGVKASDLIRLRAAGHDLGLIARRGAELVMEQIFVHGFFHADPHPGNIFILPENTICFIDFGQMGRLSRKDREQFTTLVHSLAQGEERRIIRAILNTTLHPTELDSEALGHDVLNLMDRYLYLPLAELRAAEIIPDLVAIANRHRVFFKPGFSLMFKALATVEGVGRMLDPQIMLFELARPFVARIQRQRLHPKRMIQDLALAAESYGQLMAQMPEDLASILQQLRAGQMRLAFEHRGIQPLQRTLDQIANRIAFAIVLAALIVGSSLIVLSGIPPRWYNIPVIGLIGYLLAGCLGFTLLLSMLRRGRM